MIKILRIIGIIAGVFLGWIGGVFLAATTANLLLPAIFENTQDAFHIVIFNNPLKFGIFHLMPTVLSFLLGYVVAPKPLKLKTAYIIIGFLLIVPIIGLLKSPPELLLNFFILWLWKAAGLGAALFLIYFFGLKKEKRSNNSITYFVSGGIIFLLGLGLTYVLDGTSVSQKIIGMSFLTTVIFALSLFGKAFYLIISKPEVVK